MGARMSKLWEDFRNHPVNVTMLGLDGAGKTTILNRLKSDEPRSTIPTVGFNIETVTPCKGLTLTIWDVGGQDILRSLWKNYLRDTEGLLFVVDSSDPERFSEAREALFNLLANNELRVPILVLANKQDQHTAKSVTTVAQVMGLTELSQTNKWRVHGCCAATGEGIIDGFQLFSKMTKEHRKSMSS